MPTEVGQSEVKSLCQLPASRFESWLPDIQTGSAGMVDGTET